MYYAFNTKIEQAGDEPITYTDTIKSPETEKWIVAMQDEIDSLNKNETWVFVDRPRNQKLVGCKWIYKLKESPESKEPIKYKSRLVAKGFTQTEGIDYGEIFSPVVRHTFIRVLLSLTAAYILELEQLDVKTAFLRGDLEESIYMQQPTGFIQLKC